MKRRIWSFLAFPITFGIGLFVFKLVDSNDSQIEVFSVPVETFAEQNNVAPDIGFTAENDSNEYAFSEYFTDSSRIGRRGKNKVELRCFDNGEGKVAEIRFYSRFRSGLWTPKQFFRFDHDNLLGCEPEIKDFNNDGLKDLTYRSSVAARGANEVRTLFVYNSKEDELVHIKNSEDFPNLDYNKKLRCIDAWLFHGATTTVFLRLEGDTLREFASVDTGLERVVTVTNKGGFKRVLSRKKMHPDHIYTRYSSYAPPTP